MLSASIRLTPFLLMLLGKLNCVVSTSSITMCEHILLTQMFYSIGQVAQIAVIIFTIVSMILVCYCMCAGKRLCSGSKDSSNPITQAAVDMIRDPIPNTTFRSDDSTVNSDAASEDVMVKVTRIRIPVEINIGPSTRG